MRQHPRRHSSFAVTVALSTTILGTGAASLAMAQPAVLDPSLQVTTVTSGLASPTAIGFIGANDLFVAEKNTGRVLRVTNGVAAGTVLDLAVNAPGQRGLLGMAVSPNFATDHSVFVYSSTSASGTDSTNALDVPLLGNRVDRFTWDGATLTLAGNVIQLRALQNDPPQAPGSSNNGGALRFSPDGKLYVSIGDVGRRGFMQNLSSGPTGTGIDDIFGGPAPDSAHLTGVVLRLNPDGTTPVDNPFFAAGAALGGAAGANIQKVYAYGLRNVFGMAIDQSTGALWSVDNGDDAFDEVNRLVPGANGDWIQFMGPLSRFADFKAIETASANGLGQDRYPASSIAADATAALAATVMLPGATHLEPELSWLHAIAPSAVGFQIGGGIGDVYAGSMFIGAATSTLDDGYLLRLRLDFSRQHLDLSADSRLADRVADNTGKFNGVETESLRFGSGFGTVTDIQTGPDGRLYVVSLSQGAIYAIGPAGDTPVPVPATAALLGAGLVALRALRGRAGR